MLTSVVFLPVPPVLVPELAGGAAAETAGLRDAVLAAAAALGDRWSALGAHTAERLLPPTTTGTFAGFGVDVEVALGPLVGPVTPDVPLPALVAGWVRGQVSPAAEVSVTLVAQDSSPARCAELGRALAVAPDDDAARGLLVLGDGCTTLTARAPGGLDPRAAQAQAGIEAALGSADGGALAALDPQLAAELGIGGRVPWQVAAALAGRGWRATLRHASAPFGVGYVVAVWQR